MAIALEHPFYLYIETGTNQMVENKRIGRVPGKAANPRPLAVADDLSAKINPGSMCAWRHLMSM